MYSDDNALKKSLTDRPNLTAHYDTGLDMPSGLIAEMQRSGKRTFTKQTFDLSVARDISANPLIVTIPCYTVMALYFQTASATRKAVNGLVQCRVETNQPECEFSLKHSRQVPFGPLTRVYLGWQAQAGNSVELYFLHFQSPGMAINEFVAE